VNKIEGILFMYFKRILLVAVLIIAPSCFLIRGKGFWKDIIWKKDFQKEQSINAGILPYCYDNNGNAYILIGKERNSNVWGDFGGSAERNDRNALETASREASEETRFIFGKYIGHYNVAARVDNNIRRLSQNYFMPKIKGFVLSANNRYRMYLAHVDFIPAHVFKNAPTTKGFDKIDYEWVPAVPFMQAIGRSRDRLNTYYQNKKMRSHFYDTVQKNSLIILRVLYPWGVPN
jgi:8-oxo-dGTP pyrophosphatase MutT (NUDIX family)